MWPEPPLDEAPTPGLQPKERKHISVSELREWLGCPLRFWYRYRLGLWTDTTETFFAMGNAVHAGLAAWYMSEVTDGARDADKALRVYRTVWHDEQARVDWDAEPEKDPLLLAQTGAGLLQRSMDEPDEWRARSVETTLYADIVHSRLGKLPFPLKVRLDMLTDQYDVVEHKTASARWPKGKENADMQATGEAMVVRDSFGHDPLITFNILVANKRPDVDRRSVTRTQDDIDRLYVQARALLDAEEKGAIWPNPTAFAHPHCEFRQLCDAWTEHPQAVPSGHVLQALVRGLGDRAARVRG